LVAIQPKESSNDNKWEQRDCDRHGEADAQQASQPQLLLHRFRGIRLAWVDFLLDMVLVTELRRTTRSAARKL
jgi:hypothetical protein